MALPLRCWTFSKRENSTAVPTGAATEFDINLKAPCSMNTPTFLISADTFPYNYMQYTGSGAYYWVTDVVSVRNGLWEVSGEIDVLATYKPEIQATAAFVMFSQQVYDLDIIDNRLPSVLNFSTQYANVTPTSFDADGFYCLVVAGQGGSGNTGGFTKMYGMSASQMRSFADNFYTLDENALTELRDFFVSPYNSVVDVFWVPFTLSGYGGGDDSIILGNVALEINGEVIAQRNHSETVTLTIVHPYSDYRDVTDVNRVLYLPFVGFVNLDSSDLYGLTTLSVQIETDLFVGGIVYRVYATSTAGAQVFLGIYGESAKGNVPVGQNSGNLLKSPSLFYNVAQNLFNYFTSGEEIGEGVYAGQPRASGTFSSTAMANMPLDIQLCTQTRNRSEAPTAQNAVQGNACGQTLSLGSLSGYVQTRGASVAIDGELDHCRRINAFLDGGVYIE